MELFNHQKTFLEANPAKHLACWDTGTGKTLVGVEWLKLSLGLGRGLVICPKALKKNWLREVEKRGAKDILVLTKEEFRRDWNTLPPYLRVVVDEAHHFAGRKSQMSAALRSYIKKWNVPKILLLTATPYRSSPWDIFVLATHLGTFWSPGKFLDRFFEQRFVGREIIRFGKKQRRMIWSVKNGIEQDMARLVAKIGSTVRLDECVDVPPQINELEVIELTDAQVTKKKATFEPNSMVRYTKYHEIENGFLMANEYEPNQFFPSHKEDRIVELAEDNAKIIIVCRYHPQMDRLAEILKPLGKPIFKISGKVRDRDGVVQEAEAAEEAIVIAQAACSEGYELPSFPLMVFASLDFSYVNYKQMRGRILRINKLKKNVYLHLVCSGIDTAVYASMMKKQDFSFAIYSRDYEGKTDEEILGEGFPDEI